MNIELDTILNTLNSKEVTVSAFNVEGKVKRIVGLTIETKGLRTAIGSRCQVRRVDGEFVNAEVIGFSDDLLYLMPLGSIEGISPGAKVINLNISTTIPVGQELLGRVIDSNGTPLDSLGPLHATESRSLRKAAINPLERERVSEPLDVGIQTINSLLTVGRGQRMGLFAGSGVGKSVLLGMMTKFTTADIIVVGLIGERGREVKDFIEENLGARGLERSVVIATPADTSPVLRLNGAAAATTVAEYFAERGAKVLLLLDSLTRYAQAQREIGLAVGEPPATKGYPPSVFAMLPTLVERAGNIGDCNGSITAFYTVLVEGDDQNDPIADSARAVLDGHIVLTRELANKGHYPAIDISQSISRAMNVVVDDEHFSQVIKLKQIYTLYRENEDLISLGAYKKGGDPEIDLSIEVMPSILKFLRQSVKDEIGYGQSKENLGKLIEQIEIARAKVSATNEK